MNQAGPPDDEEFAQGLRGLSRLRTLQQLFDQAFPVPGTQWRFGLDGLLGLIPGVGDIAGGLVAVYALRVARQLRAPQAIQLHMLTNIALDALIGSIPLLGDLFDFVYKAQTRNLKLLDDWLQTPQRAVRKSRRSVVLIPLAIVLVFATLTILGVWLLWIVVHWLGSLFTGA